MLARLLELEILRGQLGVEEGPAANTGERVHEYQDSGSYPYTSAWCADFGGAWGHRLATGARRVKVKGEYELKGGEVIPGGPGNTASCIAYELCAQKRGWVVGGKPLQGDKMILDSSGIGTGHHFTTIDVVQKLIGGLLYVVTIEGNTTSFDALTTTPHNRDGVYRKRRIVRRSSVTIIRVPGIAKPVDPLAIAALNRLSASAPKPAPKPRPSPAPKPAAPKVAPAILRAHKGYFAWLAWTLAEGDWKGYGMRNATVRPHVRKKITSAWWARRTAFLARRKK